MSHTVTELWRGEEVETLADLIPKECLAIVVGINPSPVSVAAGHYYQGTLGKTLWKRLKVAALLPTVMEGWEDDTAYRLGIGFTDIVKRPSRSAESVERAEYVDGVSSLREKIVQSGARLVIFTFKKSAEIMFGKFAGCGFTGKKVGSADVFVMPGPYEKALLVAQGLEDLRRWWLGHSGL